MQFTQRSVGYSSDNHLTSKVVPDRYNSSNYFIEGKSFFIPWEHYTQLYGLCKVGIKQKTLNTIRWECTQLEMRRGGHTHWTIPGKKKMWKATTERKRKIKGLLRKKRNSKQNKSSATFNTSLPWHDLCDNSNAWMLIATFYLRTYDAD